MTYLFAPEPLALPEGPGCLGSTGRPSADSELYTWPGLFSVISMFVSARAHAGARAGAHAGKLAGIGFLLLGLGLGD